jgi:glycosyltransferase involved in cell wall biosynthesis
MIAPGPFFVDRGFGVLVYEQARALQRRAVHVEVACYPSGRDVPDLPIHRVRALPFVGYEESRIGPSLSRVPLWFLLLIKAYLVARRLRPDVLHGHLHEGALIAGIVSRLTGVPWVFDFQGSLTLEMAEKGFLRESSLVFRAASRMEGWIDRMATRILVKSVVMQEDLIERFGVSPQRVRRVMDGADPNLFSPRPAEPALRARLGIEQDDVVIGYLGLLTEQQGIERLLRAVPEVLAEQPKSHFLVIGYPVDHWIQMARDLGVDQHVTFTDRVEHFAAPDYLALARLAVAPKVSRTEGNGKVYHYMSMALPVVAIDSAGNRDLLGDDGFYARGASPSDFARGIVDALHRCDEWDARGKRLRTRLIERFTWNAVASRIMDAYREEAPATFRAVGEA